MKRTIIALILANICGLFLISCKEAQIPVFGKQHYLYFENPSDNIYRFSFATAFGKNEVDFKLPLKLIGRGITEDKQYSIELLNEFNGHKMNAPEETFEISNQIFHKQVSTDSLIVKLKNSPSLNEDKTIIISLKNNDNFLVGPEDKKVAIIIFSNTISQPKWWDETVTNTLLGKYSDIKYKNFIKATKVSDFSKKTSIQMIAYTTSYIYYLRELDREGKTLFEEDGKTKVLDTIIYAKNV